MHINIVIPFWGMIGIIVAICLIVCYILSYFGSREGGYLGGLGHAIGIVIVGFCTIAICLGMIAGKYLF